MRKTLLLFIMIFVGFFILHFPLGLNAQNAVSPMANFLFEGDSPKLLETYEPNLKKLHKFMKRNKSMVIELRGHTNGCSSGEQQSKELSLQRAEVIKAYLVNKGIKYERILTVGYGCSQMLYRNPRNAKEEQANRRVEVAILRY